MILKYTLSEYLEKSAEGLERSIEGYVKSKLDAIPVLLDAAEQMGLSIGRVIDVRDSEIGMNLTKYDGIGVGTELKVYRKQMDGSFTLIADAKVLELSPFLKRASLTNKKTEVRNGDLIFLK